MESGKVNCSMCVFRKEGTERKQRKHQHLLMTCIEERYCR